MELLPTRVKEFSLLCFLVPRRRKRNSCLLPGIWVESEKAKYVAWIWTHHAETIFCGDKRWAHLHKWNYREWKKRKERMIENTRCWEKIRSRTMVGAGDMENEIKDVQKISIWKINERSQRRMMKTIKRTMTFFSNFYCPTSPPKKNAEVLLQRGLREKKKTP